MNIYSLRCSASKRFQRGTSPCFARPLQHYTNISSSFFPEPTRRRTNNAFSATTPSHLQLRPCNEPFIYGICARKPTVARRSSSSQRACTKEKREPVSLSSRTSFPFTPTGNLCYGHSNTMTSPHFVAGIHFGFIHALGTVTSSGCTPYAGSGCGSGSLVDIGNARVRASLVHL